MVITPALVAARVGTPPDGAPPAQRQRPLRLNFANIDVSDALQAIAQYFRANIVMPAQVKKPITLTATVASVDDALRLVASAGDLAFRQIGDTYVIAPTGALRIAIEPFGERLRVKLNTLTPQQAVTLLDSAVPYLTARPAGTQVLLIGAPEDIALARGILSEQDPVAPIAEVQGTELITLQYANAAQVVTMLKSMFPTLKAEAVGAADRPGGVVGLAGPRSQLDAAREAIRVVDIPTAPREPDRIYRVYAIKYSSAPQLKAFLDKAAPDVSALMGPETYAPLVPTFRPLSGATLGGSIGGLGGGSAGGGGGGTTSGAGGFGGLSGLGGMAGQQVALRTPVPGDRAKSLVLSGLPAHIDAAVKLLEEIDIPPIQVMVDVKVVDTSPERAEELGLKWNWTRFGLYEARPGTPVDTSNTGGIGGDFTQFFTRPVGFGQFSRVPWSFQAILGALITRKEAKLLADPRIQVSDNEDANIFIGDTIRARIIAQGGLTGTTIQIAEFPVGIILLVRPRVNADGNVSLRVHPVVSTITSIDSDTGIPNTSAREAETTVMLKAGETVVIGGLIRDELSKTVSEVPFLSKLPLVGELFRNRSTNHRHSEVLVFLTPHIIK